jgi:transcriptional regulator with GAF, ATPase, and Fis domain
MASSKLFAKAGYSQRPETSPGGVADDLAARSIDRRGAAQAALVNSTWALTSLVDLRSVLSSIAREAATALRVDDAAIYLFDRETDTLSLSAVHPPARPAAHESAAEYPLYRSLGEARILSQPNVVIEHAGDESLAADRRQTMSDLCQQTCLTVPLWFNERPLGIMRLADTRHQRTFDRTELDVAATFGRHAAAAIDRARTVTALANAERLLGIVTRVSRGLAEAATIDDAMDCLCRGCIDAFSVSGVDVYVCCEEEERLVASWSHSPSDPVGAAAYVGTRIDLAEHFAYRRAFQRGRVVEYHLDDPNLAETDPELHRQMQEWGEATLIEVGILLGDEPLGVLSLSSTRAMRYLSESESEVALTLAALAAGVLHTYRAVLPQSREG